LPRSEAGVKYAIQHIMCFDQDLHCDSCNQERLTVAQLQLVQQKKKISVDKELSETYFVCEDCLKEYHGKSENIGWNVYGYG